MKSRQVKAHLTSQEAKRLDAVRKRFGFKSDYEFVRASILFALFALEEGGVGLVKDSPDELRQYIGLQLYDAFVGSITKSNYYDGDLFSEDDSLNITKEQVPSKEWRDKFARLHYERLYNTFACREQTPRLDDGYTPLDIFNDTILRLYIRPTLHRSYEEWEKYVLSKFRE